MSPAPTPHDVRYFATPNELRDWFDQHHATATELWVGYHRKASGVPSIDWPQAVDEALCVGWIDGIRYRIDETRFAQRFTPRRPGSTWSAVNVAKVATLAAQGRMRPTGSAAFAARTGTKTGIYGYEQADPALDDAATARFMAEPAAWADWQRRPPSYRKSATYWVTSAKQAATRERRLLALIEACAAGRPVGPLTRPDGR